MVDNEGFKNLANAIIEQACKDYLNTNYIKSQYAIEEWIKTEWFELLSRGAVSPQALINHLRMEVQQNGKKKAVKENSYSHFFTD